MKSKKALFLLNFIVPFLFTTFIFLILYLVAAPMMQPYLGLYQYLTVRTAQPQPANLFKDLSKDLQNSTTLAASEIVFPAKGDTYGKIEIGGTSVSAPLLYGDSAKELNQGIATYADNDGSGIPGQRKTILLAGHNTTFCNGLQDVKEADIIKIETHYGVYEYRITEMHVAKATDTSTYDFSRTQENLILYTCYPFDEFGLTPYRYFVYAEPVSGPAIDKER